MDACNTFETPQTAKLARLEWGGLLAVSAVAFLTHLGEIDWLVFVGLFVVIDAVGYVPGAIAYRRSRDHSLPKVYYVLYNTMHCLFTWTVILGVATLVVGWQWSMLAVPLHLLGDRTLFGNSLKSYGVSFEPQTHPAFADFLRRYATTPVPWRPVAPVAPVAGGTAAERVDAGAEDDHVAA